MTIELRTRVADDVCVAGAKFQQALPSVGATAEGANEMDRGKIGLSQLLYISDAAKPMSLEDLGSLIATCRRNNVSINLTGLLLYSAGHFVQLLEGHWSDLTKLMCTISEDTRHHNFQILYSGPCSKRLFPKWEMGLLNVDLTRELDQAALLEGLDLLKKQPDARTVVSVFKRFGSQLSAKSDQKDRSA